MGLTLMKPEKIAHVVWHAQPATEVVAALETGDRGLTDAEAERRREAFGANILPRPKRRSALVVYLAQFKSPLIYLLVAAAAVSLAIGELTDALFIFAVLQINAVIGTVQEWRAETSAEALHGLIRNRVVLVRDGLRREVDSVELVPGDVVRLESGSLVPADIRLLACHDRKLDESLLTGESLPVGKDPDAAVGEQTPVGDRRTMISVGVCNCSTFWNSGGATAISRRSSALATTLRSCFRSTGLVK